MQIPYRRPGKYSQIKNDPFLTVAKFDELEHKLARLKKSHPAAAAEVRRLAELGDFSENVEYQLAKGKLRGLNNAILAIERQIIDAEIIIPETQKNRVQIGHIVTIVCAGVKRKYHLLGSAETNPQKGIISHHSPIGAALIGKKLNDCVKIRLASKAVVCEILKIE
ncbi:MAG: GreA/GreB family elongation factor [Patescibacteria group bacterium]